MYSKPTPLSLIIQVLGLTLIFACANQISPNGGDRDKVPPKIVKTIPQNQSLYFDRDKVILVFDEPIKKATYNKEIFISPLLKSRPKITVNDNSRRLRIKFNEELRPNTTYVIGVQEVTDFFEGNKLEGTFTYAFSTGDQLDSMSIKGRVYAPQVGKGQKDMLLMLFDADSIKDNNFLRVRPAYVNKSAEDGSFEFNYLRDTPYRILGVIDTDQSNTYSQPSELVAISEPTVLDFTDTLIQGEISLYSFLPDQNAPIFRRYEWFNDSVLVCQFDENLWLDSLQITMTDTLGQDSVALTQYMHIKNNEHELLIESPRLRTEPSRLYFYNLADSLRNVRDTMILLNSPRRRTLENPVYQKPAFDFEAELLKLTLAFPASSLDSTQLFFTDTTKLSTLANDSTFAEFFGLSSEQVDSMIQADPTQAFPMGIPKTVISTEGEGFELSILPAKNLNKKNPYVLHIRGDFFGEKDSLYRYVLRWPDPKEFGLLSGKVEVQGYEGPLVLQLLKEGKTVKHTGFERTFTFNYVEPGAYQIQVILDQDSNQVWSPGDIKTNRYPEKIILDSRQESVRANWEIEGFDIVIDPEQVRQQLFVKDSTAQEEAETDTDDRKGKRKRNDRNR